MSIYERSQRKIEQLERRIETLEQQIAAAVPTPALQPEGDEELRNAVLAIQMGLDDIGHKEEAMDAVRDGRLIPIPRFRPASEWPGDEKQRICRWLLGPIEKPYWHYGSCIMAPTIAGAEFLDWELPE